MILNLNNLLNKRNVFVLALNVFFVVILFIISYYIFYHEAFYRYEYPSDLFDHNVFTLQFFSGEIIIFYPLYHITLYGFKLMLRSGFRLASVYLLSLAKIITFELNYLIIKKRIKKPKINPIILFYSFSIMFVSAIYFPLFNPYIYKGQSSPNIWHNPTTIFCLPFILASIMFYDNYINTEQPKKKRKYLMFSSIFLVLSTLAKPNFIIAFIPGLALYLLIRFPWNWKVYIENFIMLFPSLLIISIQYLIKFTTLIEYTAESSIIFDFLGVWSYSSPNPLVSLLLLILFPLSILAFDKKGIKEDIIILIWLIFMISIAEYAFLAESGPQYLEGNFGWTRSMTSNLLFIYAFIGIENLYTQYKTDRKKMYYLLISVLIFLAHLVSGIYYTYRIAMGYGFR